jgi:SAM-dependent methyltransferase
MHAPVQKIFMSLRRNGVAETARLVLLNSWQKPIEYWRVRQNRFDQTNHDIDTAAPVDRFDLGLADAQVDRANRYEPITEAGFYQMLAATKLDTSQHTFVDLGSGKGRALFLAERSGFRRVVGVELSAILHDVAVANVKKLSASRPGVQGIELICQDAREYVFRPEPTLLYMYNPFPEDVVRECIGNLHRIAQQGLPCTIVYANPAASHVISSQDWLKIVDRGTIRSHDTRNHGYLIYSSTLERDATSADREEMAL